jgi:hypothetical protein
MAVAHSCNPSTLVAGAGGLQGLRAAWSTEQVPGQPGLHKKTLSQKSKYKQKREKEGRKEFEILKCKSPSP